MTLFICWTAFFTLAVFGLALVAVRGAVPNALRLASAALLPSLITFGEWGARVALSMPDPAPSRWPLAVGSLVTALPLVGSYLDFPPSRARPLEEFVRGNVALAWLGGCAVMLEMVLDR